MKSIFSTIIKTILPILLVAGMGIWAWHHWISPINPSGWFTSQPLRIDETPLLITEMKSIAELHAAKLYCEVVVDSIELSPAQRAGRLLQGSMGWVGSAFKLLGGGKSLVLVAKGEVMAGLDLSQFTEQQVRVHQDSVWVQLPASRILDVIINPSDFQIFQEEGDWSGKAVLAVKQKAKQEMLAEAQRRNLLKQADNRATTMMKSFLTSAGFNFIDIK